MKTGVKLFKWDYTYSKGDHDDETYTDGFTDARRYAMTDIVKKLFFSPY